MKILVVEDEKRMAALIRQGLEEENYLVETLHNGSDVLVWLKLHGCDAIILDIQLPGLDGLNVCRRLRAAGYSMPVVMLTARATLDNKVQGLDCGADDYVTKPFAIQELTARLRAVLRRDGSLKPSQVRVGDLVLDPAARELSRCSQPIELTSKEYLLVELLMNHPGQVFSREQILNHAWNNDFEGDSKVVEVFIHTIRRKIAINEESTSPIKTVRGMGYKLEASL